MRDGLEETDRKREIRKLREKKKEKEIRL